MDREIQDILDILIDQDLMEFKCFDILKEKLQNDQNFRSFVKENVQKGLIRKFPRELFNAICNQNIRASFEPIEIFTAGYNIGRCTVMSKIIGYSLSTCDICGGTLSVLKETQNSPDGRHTWVSVSRWSRIENTKNPIDGKGILVSGDSNYVIDPSLMIMIDENITKEMGYIEENRYNPTDNPYYRAAKEYALDLEIRAEHINRKKSRS